MFSTSKIELSLAALRTNIRFIKRRIGPGVRFSSVIKGNAYGHGIAHFLPMAERCGADHFSVFSAEEALEAVRCRQKPGSEIMVMGAVDGPELEWAVEQDVSFWIFDLQRLEAAGQVAERLGRPARIHLELETGLNRTGLDERDLEPALELLGRRAGHFRLEGVCTHFAGAESQANYLRIQQQIDRFERTVARLAERGYRPPLRHTACSAAAFNYPQTRMELCRIGIMQYGFWPSIETRVAFDQANCRPPADRSRDPLRRVMRWSSRIMALKEVGPGEYVGYGNSYLTTRRERFASVPVGYGQGFARSLSNLGYVLIHGKRARVIGLVNMSMMLVDVTNIPQARVGDEVVLIGKQGHGQITVASFSDLSRNLNYEVLVRLPAEIPRVVVG